MAESNEPTESAESLAARHAAIVREIVAMIDAEPDPFRRLGLAMFASGAHSWHHPAPEPGR